MSAANDQYAQMVSDRDREIVALRKRCEALRGQVADRDREIERLQDKVSEGHRVRRDLEQQVAEA